MTENLRSAFQGIWAHKLRSFLTMLGVIIGIASIIAIVSAIKGTNVQIMQNLIGTGNNCVTVSLQQGGAEYWMDAGLPKGVTPVSEDQMDRIREGKEVRNASFYVRRSYVDGMKAGDKSLSSGSLMGIDRNYLDTVGYSVFQGRPLVDADYTHYRKNVLIDETAADTLFPDGNAIGGIMEIKGEPFTVVGLIRKEESAKPVINSFQDYQNYTQQAYGTVFMPDVCWPILFQFDEPQNCVVRAETTEAMSHVGTDTAKIMNESVQGDAKEMQYRAEDLLEKVKNKQELSSRTNSMLIWIASIALLVGGIGVMNIMLVSVTERTSEIGLKKALGARRKRILAQFLTESAVLTSIGGIFGVAAGLILAEVISRVSDTPVAISVPAIFLGVAFSMLIGIVFGLLPSVKAANLNPIDALRRE